jgi:hypothetical protein
VVELIERHRAEVRARIRQLQQLERELAVLAEQGSKVDPAECDSAGICKVIPTEASVARSPVRTRSGRPGGGPTRPGARPLSGADRETRRSTRGSTSSKPVASCPSGAHLCPSQAGDPKPQAARRSSLDGLVQASE